MLKPMIQYHADMAWSGTLALMAPPAGEQLRCVSWIHQSCCPTHFHISTTPLSEVYHADPLKDSEPENNSSYVSKLPFHNTTETYSEKIHTTPHIPMAVAKVCIILYQ